MNIAFLIPSTSKGHKWNSIEESFLFKFTLSTLLNEYKNGKFTFIFYIGYNNDDEFYNNLNNQNKFKKKFRHYTFKFIPFKDVQKGHLTRMWNILYFNALIEEKYFIEYFYQCGDDISFETIGWLPESIKILKNHNNIGISGPLNENPHIMTQTLISRKHYAIFNCLFPEKIFNWGCDDWINAVYKPDLLNPTIKHKSVNSGGDPRYNISNYDVNKVKKMANKIAMNDKIKLVNYLRK